MRTIDCTDIATLQSVPAGTLIALEGVLIALRDRTLMRLSELRAKGDPLPLDFGGRVVLFAGPTPGFERGRGAVGPTTSRRMAAYLPLLADLGIAAFIGKGPLDRASLNLVAARRILYLQAAGGAGAFYGKRVISIKTVGCSDFGPEALYELTVRDFVVIMSSDMAGD